MKNFFDCKDEKITEKAFSQSLIISVISILLCIVMLCSLTYAWFTSETSSSSNTLKSGSFDLDVKIERIENDAVVEDVTGKITEQEGVWSGTLSQGKYRVTLTRSDGSTANGYCFVKIEDGEKQPTATIANVNTEGVSAQFTFTVTAESDTAIELTPWWGIAKDPVIENGGSAPVAETTPSGE